MTLMAVLENRMVTMECVIPATKVFIKSARVDEGFSFLTEVAVEFLTPDTALDMTTLVGTEMTVSIENPDGSFRKFKGVAVEVEHLGLYQGYFHYIAHVRPKLFMLTRSRNNRVLQEMTVLEILRNVLGEAGLSEYEVKTSATYEKRLYTVQFDETDFDFVSRLMEEEGLYYFFGVPDDPAKMIITDGITGHAAMPGGGSLDYHPREQTYRRTDDHIFEWQGADRITTGKVTLRDYDFERPRADLTSVSALPKGNHNHKDYESYVYPGRYRVNGLGSTRARIKMQQEAAKYQTRRGVGNARGLGVGRTFSLDLHPRSTENAQYLVTRATHLIQIETDKEGAESILPILPGRIDIDQENSDAYRVIFDAIPKDTPYRAPLVTPWPHIAGLMIALVVGPSGEEIYTDQHGRIKVQFPWDRKGQKDEHASCWVRVATSWSGNGWGMVAIPRIGQEVIIQFEDGDPDRPICTGMMYNAATMPPYALPANMTQSGIKTNSSKGGGGFNELMMEDKKGEELVRFQAEKDLTQIVKNNATITIGMEKKDAGDLTQTIYNNKTEVIKEGNSDFKIEKGSEIRFVKTDKTETVEGNTTTTIKGTDTIEVTGAQKTTVKDAMTVDVTKTLTEKAADIVQDASATVLIKAGSEIKLECGGASIKIDSSGVTINGVQFKVTASGMVDVSATGIMKLAGSLVKIN